ncbi:MAG: hypothetical protein FWD36_03435 [Treponema sp.]|nr:hypothetical protein [Treponema sp.]
MKKKLTKEQVLATGLAIITLFVFAACKNEPAMDSKCECPEKGHLGIGEDCCDAKNCNCALKVYGTITDLNDNVIKFYRDGEIKVGEMEAIITRVKLVYYEGMGSIQKTNFFNKITEIHVKPTNGMSKNGSIFTIGCNEDLFELQDYMTRIADGMITKALPAHDKGWKKLNRQKKVIDTISSHFQPLPAKKG